MIQSCVHDPFPATEFEPMEQDTMMIDTMMIDTMMVDTSMQVMPCDSNVIYYNIDIQPLLDMHCATAGCHDDQSAAADVILTNYESTISTSQVIAFDLNGSKLYNVITDDDEEEVMPPTGKLENNDINLIALWILQGAEKVECDQDCEKPDVSYTQFVSPIMQQYCNACHSSDSPSAGIITDTHAGMEAIANDGRLYGAINWSEGFSEMPQGQDQLNNCDITMIKTWIDEGALDN